MQEQKMVDKQTPHCLSLTNRSNINLSGIIEVISATDKEVILKTTIGSLNILGNGLKIKNLNSETKELSLLGEAYEIKYNKSKKLMFSKIFK